MKKVEYMGYIVNEDGNVFNKFGKQLSKIKHKKSSTLSYCIRDNGKQKLIPCARFVYQAFNPETDLTGYIVKTSQPNKYNLCYLYTIKLNELNYTKFNKMQLKRDIFNRMIEHRNNNRKELADELLWVLGGKNE
jgi:hypothetical protein